MIKSETYRNVHNGVCAIGYLTEPLEVYSEHRDQPIFQAIGTGFIAKGTVAVTNRHVIAGLMEAMVAHVIPPTQLFVQFVVSTRVPMLEVVPRMIRQASYVDRPELDLGFITYKTVHEEHFTAIHALPVVEHWSLTVGDPVAVCGYPYGTAILFHDHITRWGPVLQQGHISAVSPFDTTAKPDEILLDVRTAPGMSGAPVFTPSQGEVVGVHYAGIEGTTAFAIPITRASLEAALEQSSEHSTIINAE